MSQESFVFLLGLLVILTPFMGIPNDWKEWIFIVLGMLIVIGGYRLRRGGYFRSLDTQKGERRAEAFVENDVPLRKSKVHEA